jgi:uncharacterized glyoxalase superfamily protein PhnB
MTASRAADPIDGKPLPTIAAHIIVRDAARAADWYGQAHGAELGTRIRVPDGCYLQIELRLGDCQGRVDSARRRSHG